METTIDGKTMDPKERIQDAVMRFMEEYFNVSMANPAALANMYREDSLMIFDGQKIRGKESILAKLTSLQQCRHQVLKIQCLPTGSNDLSSGFTGLVCGCIWPDGKQHARNFSQDCLSLSLSVERSLYILSISFLVSKDGLDEMAFLLIEYHLGRSLRSLLVAEYLFIRFIANRIVAPIKFHKKRKEFTFLSYYFF